MSEHLTDEDRDALAEVFKDPMLSIQFDAVERIVTRHREEAWDEGCVAGSALASHPQAGRLTPINPYRGES